MVFACELMDLCRGTQEVEAVLGEGGDNGSRDPLARLKMAMEYEEKKVCDYNILGMRPIQSLVVFLPLLTPLPFFVIQ